MGCTLVKGKRGRGIQMEEKLIDMKIISKLYDILVNIDNDDYIEENMADIDECEGILAELLDY